MKPAKRLLLLALAFPLLAMSQTMEKELMVGEAGIGLAVYQVRITEKVTGYNFNNDGYAVGSVFPITVEYGIHKRFSVGGTFKYTNYFEDSTGNATQAYNSFDLAARPAFHFVSRDRFNMNMYGLLGASLLSYNSNDSFNIKGTGVGPTFGFGLDMRIFFSGVIGMYLNWNYATYTYRDFEYSDGQGNVLIVDWEGAGSNIGIGLTFKLN